MYFCIMSRINQTVRELEMFRCFEISPNTFKDLEIDISSLSTLLIY